MAVTVVVVSGPGGAGKTTLAQGLARRFGARQLRSRDLLPARDGEGPPRDWSATLDEETGGRWLAEAVLTQHAHPGLVVVDAVSSAPQVEGFRRSPRLRVVHVHLEASGPVRAASGAAREAAPPHAEAAWGQPSEHALRDLEPLADLVLDTERLSADAVLVRVASRLGLYGRPDERLVDVLIGGPRGQEDTGPIAAHLAPGYDVLLRVGGLPPEHRGDFSTFPQLPSGAHTASGARLVLGPGTPVCVERLRLELEERGARPEQLFIDPRAVVLEVGHPGVKEAHCVAALQGFLRPTLDVLDDAFARRHRVLLEGTPTRAASSDATASGCLAAAGIAPGRVARTVLVCPTLEGEEPFAFDWVGLRRSASLNAPTDLVLGLGGALATTNWGARRFEQLTDAARRHVEEVERVAGAPVTFLSLAPQSRHLLERKPW
ncbi:hypothetical protein G4177_07965 [Corallococcus sp. ZKHCc1 1396]|uniref:AAA+ ATPase domain-containing protein n=1 Tax=Corallococcus soli TaxID=2710757 RepID=A0ABR9PJM8_9BACT|nr:AAA family ATPase [Corallococcus soli]MBE4748115.1 hypothetical protein [Corallococcus soli]